MVDEVIGKYKVLRGIGAGGMATVFLASHLDVPSLKIVLKKLTDPSLVERFKREADKLAVLDGHSGICQIKHFFEFEGDFYIVMEFINGPTLDELIKSDDPPDLERSLQLVLSILSTLEYAHQLGIVHRDIKPTNVMVDHIGQVKIIDFGVAKGAADPDLTQAGTSLGSPRYMAPEQFNPQGPIDWARCDLYAVGMTLYYLLTRTLPFQGADIYEMCDAKRRGDLPAPSQLNPNVPPAIDAAVMKALHRDPQARFASAAEMRMALLGQPTTGMSTTTNNDDGYSDRTMVLGSDSAVEAGLSTGINPSSTIATPPTPTPPPVSDFTGTANTTQTPPPATPHPSPPLKNRRPLYLIAVLVVVALITTIGIIKFGANDQPEQPVVEILPPDLITPASGSELPGGRVKFTWAADGDSLDIFTLQYAADPAFSQGVQKQEQRGLSHDLVETLAPGIYFWRVRPGALSSADTLWSASRSFSIAAPPPVKPGPATGSQNKPKPQIQTPKPKPTPTGEALIGARLEGVPVIADGELYVDGKRRDFHFPGTVTLKAGEHSIVAVYIYEGKEVKASRTITVKANERTTFILEFASID